jgi:hypothetical protein
MFIAALSIAAASQDAWPVTHAEKTGFKETSSYSHVVEFLDGLQKVTTAQVSYVGSTQGGRKIPVVIASKPQVSGPLEAKRTGKPVVYIQANIHGGEVEGKESAQILLRELYRTDSPLLKKLIFVVVPIYNIDGNERWGDGRVNRRSQTGPARIGERTNDRNLDLNRDCIKSESPEMQTVLKHVYTKWDPDVIMDLHTTNGTRHGYPLTYSPPLHPNTHPGVYKYSIDELLPSVRKTLQKRGLETFPYGNAGPRDGKLAWSTFGWEGRYVSNYAGLRGRIGILSEAMSYTPFDERVEATSRFVTACLEKIARDADRVVAMSRKADADMVAWSTSGKKLGLGFSLISRGAEDVLMERAPDEGEDRRTGKVTAIEKAYMEVFDRFTPTKTAVFPNAYYVPATEERLVALLQRQGVKVERLREDITLTASRFLISEVNRAARPYQEHRITTLDGKFIDVATNLKAGGLIVRTGQPLGMLIFSILEPEGRDGAVAWEQMASIPAAGDVLPILKLMDASEAVTDAVVPAE